ncbi:PREDICTED: uncharacterized protein LOC109472615 isoform X1 [Branchiostoma belcheri]|uniref:Leucine-rich repeat protein SHOC-2 n=1 Tax=Branchiostoma belcheri TaxID=7741 RepID=A0A6P4YFG9_BRABE|nr:PREDICTED: uncharacterized protein LOC109472615 isoform X1 [Branchiostoma belcheri]
MKLEQLEVLYLSYNKNITLPDEMCSLVNLSLLDLGNCDLKTVPASVTKLSQLNELSLWYNKEIKLPDEMSSLVNLTHLDLDNCDLDTLPPVVLKLSNLQELDLSGNQISLPDELYKLQNIKVLGLCDCNLATVPPVVLKLTQLEELDLSRNSGIHLPDELSGLTNIRVLKLGETGMVTVPPVVWTLTKLEWLDLDSNPLQTLPAGIGQITSIKHLDLFDCKLRTLPSEIWRLTQLEWLDLSSNALQTLPMEIGKLTNIKHLDLSNCKLRTLPSEVGRLAQLEWLDLSSNALQTLPMEIGKLTNIKHLDLSKSELHTLPPEMWRLTQLEWLDLSSNALQTLPAEIGQLTNIEHLDLSECELRTLPSEVWRLTQLEWLNPSSNPLQTLPAEIGQLTNIEHLDLSNCELRTLPPEMWRLTQLEWLNLSSNPLQTLPAEIGKLTNVKHLTLSKCELHTLPPEVWRLTQLEWLNPSSNPLQTLPAEIGQLTNIEHLDLSNCELRTLPPEMLRLTQLEWLDLSSVPLQTLPAEIGQITNVKHLDLSKCKLRTLPPELWRLTQLEWLNLSSNPLQTLPAEIGQLTNIKHLDLSNCELRTLPSEVGRLTQLEWLDLRSNPLQKLPAEIGQLTNMKHLDLDNCELRTLPSEVGRLTQLERLDLSSNPLQKLPAEIGQLTNMKHLDLDNCELRTLPSEVGRLTQLGRLDLRSNPLQKLPAEIGQLTNIKHLDLDNCELRTLPSEVGRLTQLGRLDLSLNSLDALPVEIAQLTNVSYIDVSRNPLIKPPAEVCRQGINAIRLYFDELEHSEEEVSARLKVVVLGKKMAGKTSLVQTLNRGQSSLTENEDRTHCVEITQWAPEDNITFEVYDFGGHDVYHLTHQFFLTQSALNLLTVNLHEYRCTEQSYTEAVGFWLDTLNARVPGAVVTLVCSKTDMCSDTEIEEKTRDIQVRFSQQHDLWKRTIQQQMKKLESNRATNEGTDQGEIERQLERTRDLLTRPLRLTGAYCVSSAEPTSGLDKLKSHILKTANNTSLFPSLRRILPRTWVEFDQHLRDMRGNGTEEYQSARSTSQVGPVQSIKSKWLTREECLQQGQLAGLTADRLEPVLSYLQQVGTILRYTDIPELKDLVFHDPSGLIDVMKELFHHDLKKVFTKKNPRLKGFSNTYLKKIQKNLWSQGFLPREVVIALLGPHATPVGNVDVITKLMEHFGLCYTEWSDEQNGETSIRVGYYIPWYIKEERPGTINRNVTGQEFIVTCEIAHFCPRGLFERLSVVINKLIKSRQDWKDLVKAVTDSFPVIVYREKKDEHVNIVVRLIVPAQAVQGTQVIWHVIGPLKDKLSTLLKEWPGLLYRLVYSTFTQQAKHKGDQQTLSVASIIPTFEVGPLGCTVQHGGVTLEFPAGCVRDTRFISVEVEAVPVTEDVRSNFTAMSAVLTVEQDFPQRFLRPVTVRLSWAWTQSVVGKETTTVVLHYGRDDEWTFFQTDAHQEDGGIMFQTDHFQSYWVLEVLRHRSKDIISWVQRTWSDYIEDKSYIIVTPLETERLLHLICLYKSDNLTDLFESPGVRFDSRTKRRVTLKQGQWVEATFCQHEDVDIHPLDLPIHLSPDPPTTRTVRLVVRESVPIKDVYNGKVEFVTKGSSNLDSKGGRQQFEAFVQLQQRQQVVITEASEKENERPDLFERHENTELSERTQSYEQHQARPDQPPPRIRRHTSVIPSSLAISLIVVIFGVLCQFYFGVHITGFFGLPGGIKEAGVQHTSYSGKPVVLLVNDEYGTSKGGISTINRQLAKLISSSGGEVLCTVLNTSEEDTSDAKVDGVELVLPTSFKTDRRQPTLDWLTFDHRTRYPNLPPDITHIIGHASITGRAARNIREQRYPAAKLILFNHVIPEDTEHYKSESRVLGIEEKIDLIRTDTEHADVVFSVGPNLYDYYKNEIRVSKPHYEFLPSPFDIFSQMNPTYVETETKVVLSIGRVKGAERLKGYDLAAKAMSMVIGRFPKARWRVRGVSAEDFPESKEIIEANIAKGTFHFTPLKYGTQKQLSRDFKEAHVVLMPSRAEPFGLVGLEAIAAGVPTIVSDQSGLAKFLKAQDDVIFDRPIVKIKGNDEEDAIRLANRIVEILENGSKEFKAAKELKQKLLASKYWEESHRKFLEECGIQK